MKKDMTTAYAQAEIILNHLIADVRQVLSAGTQKKIFLEFREHWEKRLEEAETEAQQKIAQRCISKLNEALSSLRSSGFDENPLEYAELHWPENMPARKEVEIIECRHRDPNE